MKFRHGVTTALGLALALGACARHERKEEPQLSPEQKAAQERAHSAQQVEQTAQQFQKQRQDYRIKAETKLNDLEAKIAALKAKAPADPTKREGYMTQVSGLEGQLANARTELQQLQGATADEWPDRQKRVEQSIMTVDAAYRAAEQSLAH